MNKGAINKGLRAFTLIELLVFMIVSGIVFLAVMNGFTMLRRYAARKTEQIITTSAKYEGYCRLSDIAYAADSLSVNDTGDIVGVLCEGKLLFRVRVVDSLLVVDNDAVSDTLLNRVSAIGVGRGAGKYACDTLCVGVALSDRDLLRLDFAVVPPTSRKILLIEKKETDYTYDKPGQRK